MREKIFAVEGDLFFQVKLSFLKIVDYNHCAASLLSYYEYRLEGVQNFSESGRAKNKNYKESVDDYFFASSPSFLCEKLFGAYSRPSIIKANDFLLEKGFIAIRTDGTKTTQVALNVQNIKDELSKLTKGESGYLQYDKIDSLSNSLQVTYQKFDNPCKEFDKPACKKFDILNNTIEEPLKNLEQHARAEKENLEIFSERTSFGNENISLNTFSLSPTPVAGTPAPALVDSKKSLDFSSKFPFEAVWLLYERKGSKRISQERWNKLSEANREKAMNHIPRYIRANPDMKYRKDLERYIAYETYESTIPGQMSIPIPEQKQRSNWIEGIHFYIDNNGKERLI